MTSVATRIELADWHTLEAAERDGVLALQISAPQIEFAGPVARSVAACEAGDRAEVAGLAILVEGGVVGWVVLIRAYEKAGWIKTGERRVGRVGLERTMSLRL
jgi:hypothetical protein